ncbi:Zinc metalloprotease (elastase) [Herbaspirillum sp. CF444]|uniref:zinc metalloprotease (elastase) n=1 Tax=Herbaspirillum sp. CF444 TaxID=1144319 RepID=UPI0002724095|nr:zinc metalloprotease (elastase) [Herbaspirillum sp. CF444]EJL83514.1 Zinc metalloprotease (elastase) [Herbaspirillum sp. CF444]
MFRKNLKNYLAGGCIIPLSTSMAATREPTTEFPLVQKENGWFHQDGRAAQLFNLDWKASTDDPGKMALSYIRQHAKLLGISDSQVKQLSVSSIRKMADIAIVRFRQNIQGVPVFASDIAVSLMPDGKIIYVASTVVPLTEDNLVTTFRAEISKTEAVQAAQTWLGRPLTHTQIQRNVYVDEHKQPHSAWNIVATDKGGDEWNVVVNQADGTILDARKISLEFGSSQGYVYKPDPLTSAHAKYGDPGYINDHGKDTPQLKAARVLVDLSDITQNGDGKWQLVGPRAHCITQSYQHIADYNSCPVQTNTLFDYTRDSRYFAAINAYYHIDRVMNYVNTELQLPLYPLQYTGGVKYDPHGWREDGNDYSGLPPGEDWIEPRSRYLLASGIIEYGGGSNNHGGSNIDDPGVPAGAYTAMPDMAEDAAVIVHELGHGLHDWATNHHLSNEEGLSEGVGDYFAGGYIRDMGYSGYNKLQPWAGATNPDNIRVFDWYIGHQYPKDISNSPHNAGQYWSSCNMAARTSLGGKLMDKAMLVGLAMTGHETNQAQAAQAVLIAAQTLGFTAAQMDTLFKAYTHTCTYPVKKPG